MRINIKGNDVTTEKIAAALATCERDYNLKITGATIYVRFENAYGQTVEPLQNGEEFSRDFWFQKKRPPTLPRSEVVQTPADPEPPADAITSGEMIRLCQGVAHRYLGSNEMKVLIEIEKVAPVSKKAFESALLQVLQRDGKFNIHTLRQILLK